MFLKTLTLKGFKSFADPTTLDLEPGVTVVVGPNGSGKSNVVDAIAWVLGAQGPRVVRSAKMDDVIFAGTSSRPALGRAEVSLTIDNSARRLPIEFSEVTVTRTLFRTGESEYAINSVPCRLLDVQELLSDTGVGRQQHVIIGQGQLDTVLSARPEERRSVIEEAAGVLKYRRRRERAERRLESSEESLARLEDLLKEVRRQIRPLERQAAAARRHAELSTQLREVRLFLLGQDLVAFEQQLAEASEAASDGARRRAALLAEGQALDAAIAEQELELDAVHLDELDARIASGEQLRERARGLLARCDERRRAQAELAEVLGATSSLERLEAEQRRAGVELDAAEDAAAALAPEWAELEASEQLHRTEEQRQLARLEQLEAAVAPVPQMLFAPGDLVSDAEGSSPRTERSPVGRGTSTSPPGPGARQSLADARRRAAAARERIASARETEARLAERAAAQRDQQRQQLASLGRMRDSLVVLRRRSGEAAHALGESEQAENVATAIADEAEQVWHESIAGQQAAHARVEALELALDEARARAGLERLGATPGVLGTLPELIETAEGLALALDAALEGVLDSVLVRGVEQARVALELLRNEQGGAVLPVAQELPPRIGSSPTPAAPTLGAGSGAAAPSTPPSGTELFRPLVQASDKGVEVLLDHLLEHVVLCRGGFEPALEASLAAPGLTIVTLDGDRFSPAGWRLRAGRSGATRAALERARTEQRRADASFSDASEQRELRAGELVKARKATAVASGQADRLTLEIAQLERAEHEAVARLDQLVAHVGRAELEAAGAAGTLAEAGAELVDADQQLARCEEAERDAAQRREQADRERRTLEERARALLVLRRDLEVRAAALEERRSQLRRRCGELAGQQVARAEELAQAEERRVVSAADSEALSRLEAMVAATRSQLDTMLEELGAWRTCAATLRAELTGRLRALRAERDGLEQAIGSLGERLQHLEIELAETRIRREAAVESLRRDMPASGEEAMAATRPPCPPATTLPEHLRSLEAQLSSIGLVNPLAMAELAELEERHGFVQAQLDDVRGARRELHELVRGIDAEIVSAFNHAYADVEQHFGRLVATLFPGGEGRLSLTAPDDPLSTGVEIEARPPGRNVRRLSLLSGGERSLVALAFLFAVFRARPSPFYVMDEVEAALDEVNLRRFLALVDEFRDEAQLIVVSHQKRTMEVADSLYGITMQSGGASRAVSERLRHSRSARPASDRLVETLELREGA